MENNQNLSPFRFTEHIRKGQPLTSDELQTFNPYLINKLFYYSGAEKLCNLMSVLWTIPKEFQYKLFCILFKGVQPKGWIKSGKEKDSTNSLEIEYLKKKFQVSTKVAEEYAELLTKEEKKEIKRVWEK